MTVIVELAEVQIHEAASTLTQTNSGQLKNQANISLRKEEYVNPTPSASNNHAHLTHIMLLYSNKGLLVSSRCVKHSVYPCDRIHSEHNDLEHGKEDVERRFTVIPMHIVTSARARHLLCEKERRQLALTELTKGQRT